MITKAIWPTLEHANYFYLIILTISKERKNYTNYTKGMKQGSEFRVPEYYNH